MACSRGKAHPNSNTKLKLFSHSGGFCQNENCDNLLFPEDHAGNIHIAEMAHIFAFANDGPRPNPDLSEIDRGAFDNIILLCANCHTMIDKDPGKYNDAIITKWKRDHWNKILYTFGVVKFESRSALRSCIDPLLGENKAIHAAVGPDLEYRYNPEAAEAAAWRARVRGVIIPNSNRIVAILYENRHLLTDAEHAVMYEFKIHVDGLILHHFDGQDVVNIRFPDGMNNISKDE